MKKLTLSNLKKVFLTEKGTSFEAIEDISFSCEKGEFLSILGPTGCGKTTLLRLIAGLEEPSAGSINIEDSSSQKIKINVTLVFQQYSLFPWRNVIDNVAFGLEIKGIPKKQRYEKARYFLNLVGLNNFQHNYPYELSGGMQQRVAIARAFATDAEMLLMDEPFGALDERTRHQLQDELLKIWEYEKKTIIFVTHNIDEAIFLAQRILIMDGPPGNIIKEEGISLERPRNRLAPEFTQYYLKIREVFEKIVEK